VPGKQRNQIRNTPKRTCVGCRQIMPKRHLIRIVRTPDGVVVDRSGRVNGRGAYLHNELSCWEKGLKGPLANALRMELSPEDHQRLADFASTLKPILLSDSGDNMNTDHPD